MVAEIEQGVARRMIVVIAVIAGCTIWAPGLAAALHQLTPQAPRPHPAPFMLAAVVVGRIAGLGALRLRRLHAILLGGVAGIAAFTVLALVGAAHWVTGLSLVVEGASSGGLASIAANRLPKSLDAAVQRPRPGAIAWLILASVGVQWELRTAMARKDQSHAPRSPCR